MRARYALPVYAVRPGDIALVHAAAGSLGLLLPQIIRLQGGRVIGRVSSLDEVGQAKTAGAEHVIVDTEGNFAGEALRLSDGKGVLVVYDGSEPITFQGFLDPLRISGTLAWYGPILSGPGKLAIMRLPKSIKLDMPVGADLTWDAASNSMLAVVFGS